MDIKKIKFKSGLINNESQAKNLEERSWEWDGIPDELRDLLVKDKPWELAGTYGDPSAATPIEYKKISFIGTKETRSIEFLNLGVVYFYEKDTEELRRIFRCLIGFETIKDK